MNKINMFRSVFLLVCYTVLVITCAAFMEHRKTIYSYTFTSVHNRLIPRRPGETTKEYIEDSSKTCNGSLSTRSLSRGNGTVCSTAAGMLRRTTAAPTAVPHTPNYVLLDSDKELNLSECHRCALVFSSGHLVDSHKGREIDKADCVIRQNVATVYGHWKDVGLRTTVRVIGQVNLKRTLLPSKRARNEIFINARSKASIIFVPWLYDEYIDRRTNEIFQIARLFSRKYPDVKFFFQNDQRLTEMDKLFMRETGLNRSEIETWFSTGFMSVLFALDVCDKVICYGLSDADYCTREPLSAVRYHYYDNKPMRECDYIKERETLIKGGHKFLTERNIYAKWAMERHLTFCAPTWPMSAFNSTGNFTSPYLSIYKNAKADGSFDKYSQHVGKNVGKPENVPIQFPKVFQPSLLRNVKERNRNTRRLIQKKLTY